MFLLVAREDGVEFRTDFPLDLVPLVAGERKLAIEDILSDR